MTTTRVQADNIALTVNGRGRRVPANHSVADLLGELAVDARMVVVEHNREIVRDRESLTTRMLADGDVLEIVHFVGGG